MERFVDAMKRKDGAILDARKKVSSSSSSSRAKSSPRSLEDWNEKSTISKTAKGERANALKEEGNELFKRGDLKKAEEKYSESLDIEQNNAFVLSNRAIVRLKLGKLEACVNDCEKSLEILKTGDGDDDDDDDTNILIVKREEERERREKLAVKTWQRKGSALVLLEKFKRAIECFENALKYEPESQTLREQRTSAIEKLEKKENIRCMLSQMNSNAGKSLAPEKKEYRVKDLVVIERKEIEKEEEEETTTKPTLKDMQKQQQHADIEKVRNAISKLNNNDNNSNNEKNMMMCISTGPDFDKAFKLASNDLRKKSACFQRVPIDKIKLLLNERLSGDLLGDIITSTCTRWISENIKSEQTLVEAINWLSEITKTNRFSMSSMLLSGAHKQNAKLAWDDLIAKLNSEEVSTISILEQLDGLRVQFRL